MKNNRTIGKELCQVALVYKTDPTAEKWPIFPAAALDYTGALSLSWAWAEESR